MPIFLEDREIERFMYHPIRCTCPDCMGVIEYLSKREWGLNLLAVAEANISENTIMGRFLSLWVWLKNRLVKSRRRNPASWT